MDVKCALLNGDLTKEIYMQKPEGFVFNPYLVCKLKKSLYGLKLKKSFHGSLMIILLYVDDLRIIRSSKKEISSLKDAMNHAFL